MYVFLDGPRTELMACCRKAAKNNKKNTPISIAARKPRERALCASNLVAATQPTNICRKRSWLADEKEAFTEILEKNYSSSIATDLNFSLPINSATKMGVLLAVGACYLDTILV